MQKIHPDKTSSFWFDIILIGVFILISYKAVMTIVAELRNADPYNLITASVSLGCVLAIVVCVRAIFRLSFGIKYYWRR
jgi:hypothetical protein